MAIIKTKKKKPTFKEQIKMWPENAKINLKMKLSLISFSVVMIIIDQVSKILVVKHIPLYDAVIGTFGKGFFSLCHVRNTAIAFSMGDSFPDWLKILLFIVLTIGAMSALTIYFFVGTDLKKYHYYALAFIMAGTGNIIDRIFRFSNGVVDWLDFKWFGIDSLRNVPLLKILSYDRWPTWNIADACVIVGATVLIIGMITEEIIKKKK